MEALTLVAAAVVALFWAVVSVFAPFLPRLQPPPPATTVSKRRKRPHGVLPDLALAVTQNPIPAAQEQPPSTTHVVVVSETSSESSSLFSTAPASILSDNDTNEPLTPAPSEELVTPSSCSSARPYRKFSEFKTAFTAPFSKKRSVTLDAPPKLDATAKPRRDRSRSSSRSRASFGAIFSSSRSQVSSPASEDIPLTPDSVSSGVNCVPPPTQGKAKRSRASLPLNLPPLSRLHQRRVSAPSTSSKAHDSLPESTSELALEKSPTEDRVQIPQSEASAVQTTEIGRDRGRRTLWKRAFSRRNDSDNIQHDQHDKLEKRKPRASSTHPCLPSQLVIDTDIERRVRFSEDEPIRPPERSQTWLEHRETRVHRARARSVEPKPDRHSVSARIAQEAWGRPSAPSPASVAPT